MVNVKSAAIMYIGPGITQLYDSHAACESANFCYTCGDDGTDGKSCIPTVKQTPTEPCPEGSGSLVDCQAGKCGTDCATNWECATEGDLECVAATGGTYGSKGKCEDKSQCGPLPKTYDCNDKGVCTENISGTGVYTDPNCNEECQPPEPEPEDDDDKKTWYEEIPKEWMIGGGVLVGLIVLLFLMSLFKGKKKVVK